jgi:hypothetical protein
VKPELPAHLLPVLEYWQLLTDERPIWGFGGVGVIPLPIIYAQLDEDGIVNPDLRRYVVRCLRALDHAYRTHASQKVNSDG